MLGRFQISNKQLMFLLWMIYSRLLILLHLFFRTASSLFLTEAY